MTPTYATPLLSPDIPLDEHSRQVIQAAYDKEQAKMAQLPTDDPMDPKRMRRVEITWDEMWAQPEVIQNTLAQEEQSIRAAGQHFAKRSIDRIVMTGCGDSIASMMAVKWAYERLLGIQTDTCQALDFAYYHHSTVNERTLVICLSSSGATTRTIEAMMMARLAGAQTLTLSNTPGSILMEEADRGLLIHAQRQGWPTQSSTAAMATLMQFLIEYAQATGVDAARVAEYQATLKTIPALMKQVLEACKDPILEIAKREAQLSMYLFAGAGPALGAAEFGSAKVKECSPDRAIAIQMEEFHHYNSLKAGDPLFILAPDGFSVPRALDTAKEGKGWGGRIYSIVNHNNHAFDEYSTAVIRMPDVPEEFSAFVYAIPAQMFGYSVAMEKYRLAKENLSTERTT